MAAKKVAKKKGTARASKKASVAKKARAQKARPAPKKAKTAAKPRPQRVAKKQAPPRSRADRASAEHTELLRDLRDLRRQWPDADDPRTTEAFDTLLDLLVQRSEIPVTPPVPAMAPPIAAPAPASTATPSFDTLELIRRVLMTHDMLFLSRQVTYHVAGSSDLPPVYADVDQIRLAISQLIEHLVRRAARSSRIDIDIRDFNLRSGPGINISFTNFDHHLKHVDRALFLADLFQDRTDEISGLALSECRRLISHQGGQLWADLPKAHEPVYHLLLPASETARQPHADRRTFKYDITITNYANIRKRFGIKKSKGLVGQIEHYVRSLVRHPIDMVMAITDKGIISTIYETQTGVAESVASRISQRLGREAFHIGKRTVDLLFRYDLNPLSCPEPRQNHEDQP